MTFSKPVPRNNFSAGRFLVKLGGDKLISHPGTCLQMSVGKFRRAMSGNGPVHRTAAGHTAASNG